MKKTELIKVLSAIADGYCYDIEVYENEEGKRVPLIVVENPDYKDPWDNMNLVFEIEGDFTDE